MSLWLRERLRLAIAPEEVAMVRLGAGWGDRVAARETRRAEQVHGESPWLAACDELDRLLKDRSGRPTEASVVLSSDLYRAIALPWQDSVTSESDRLDYARHRFKRVFGDAAAQGTLRLGSARYGEPILAVSVETPLVERLAAILGTHRLRLRSLQPSLTVVFNQFRRALRSADAFVLAVTESRMLTLALVHSGAWQDVRQVRATIDSTESLETALRRELYCLGAAELPGRLFLFAPQTPRLEAITLDGVTVAPLSPSARDGATRSEGTVVGLALCAA